ncbi:MAG: hypothetical protein ABSC06_36100 [Rhodopila sp.]|jgi:hypothetical protein
MPAMPPVPRIGKYPGGVTPMRARKPARKLLKPRKPLKQKLAFAPGLINR